jgi:hypothetical protein
MTNPDLIPTVITDVNGKVTTVHKRAQSQKPVRSAIPPVPPVLSELTPLKKNPVRPYKPSADQKSPRVMHMVSWHRQVDPKLSEALDLSAPYQGARNVGFYASEVEAYSVFSVTSYENAIVLMESGIRSREEAFRFLEDNGLMHLEKDHSELMDMALRRKLNFNNFVLFMQRVYTKDVDPKLFADAAEANDIKGLREKPGPPDRQIPHLILNGDIALSDIKAMTTTMIASKAIGEATINALIAINKGERNYDAKQLRRALEEASGSLTDDETIELIDSLGFSAARSIRNKKLGFAVHWEVKDKDGYKYNAFKRMEAVQYSNIMDIYRRYDDAKVVIELFESGVEAGDAAKALNSGMTVPQVIAVHGQGAPKSISTGWL